MASKRANASPAVVMDAAHAENPAASQDSETPAATTPEQAPPSAATAHPASAATALPPFCVGSASARTNAVFPELDRLNQRCVRRLSIVLSQTAKAKLEVRLAGVDTQRFSAWQAQQPTPSCVSQFALPPLDGLGLIQINPACIVRLVDLYYGGDGAGVAAALNREMTPGEDQLAERLSQSIISALAHSWSDAIAVEAVPRGRESRAAFAAIGTGDEDVVVCRFVFSGGHFNEEVIEILYSASMLMSAQRLLSSGADLDDGGTGNSVWRAQFGQAVSQVSFKASAVLARPELPLSKLATLKPGDIIAINATGRLPLTVDHRIIAWGVVGEQAGQASIKITQLVRESGL